MASQYKISSSEHRPEVYVVTPRTAAGVALTVVPAANTDYIVDLPPGVYRIGIFMDTNVTGTTTAIDDVVPFLDKAQSIVPVIATNEFTLIQGGDSTTADKTVAAAAGAAGGQYVTVAPNSGTAQQREIPLLCGFRFTLTKGGATTGEKCIVTVVAQRCV